MGRIGRLAISRSSFYIKVARVAVDQFAVRLMDIEHRRGIPGIASVKTGHLSLQKS
jgi:hypothetical protein